MAKDKPHRATWLKTHDEHMPEFLQVIVLGNLHDYLEAATQDSDDLAQITRRGYNLAVAISSFWEHAFDADTAAAHAHTSPETKLLSEVANTYKHYKARTPKTVQRIGMSRLRSIGAGRRPDMGRSRYTVEQPGGHYSRRDLPIETDTGRVTLNALLCVAVPELLLFSRDRHWLDDVEAEAVVGDLDILKAMG